MIRDFVLPAALLSLAQLTFCHVQRAPEVTGTDIPAEMRGRWGLTRTDCDVTRPDAKGAMLVSSEMLGFYESHARLDEVDEVSPHHRKLRFHRRRHELGARRDAGAVAGWRDPDPHAKQP